MNKLVLTALIVSDSANGCPLVVGFAQELGLDVEKSKADMKGECQQLVQRDMRELRQLGVSATPSFFINGRFIAGAVQADVFASLIDQELAKANERIQRGTPAAEYYQTWVVANGQKAL